MGIGLKSMTEACFCWPADRALEPLDGVLSVLSATLEKKMLGHRKNTEKRQQKRGTCAGDNRTIGLLRAKKKNKTKTWSRPMAGWMAIATE